MKQEEPQIYGKYWRHETGDRYKQEKTEYRACRGDSWDREKSRAIQKVPCGEESGGDAEREKEWGEEESFVRKRHRERNRKPKPRQPGAGAGGEKWYRGIYGNGSGDYCIICNIGTFVFEQFRALRLCRKFSAIDSAWRIRRDGVSGAIPFIYGNLFLSFKPRQPESRSQVGGGWRGASGILRTFPASHGRRSASGLESGRLLRAGRWRRLYRWHSDAAVVRNSGNDRSSSDSAGAFGTRCCVHYGAFPGKLR